MDKVCNNIILEHLLFVSSYKIVESPDNKYGAPEEGGGWNGMVGMVARKVWCTGCCSLIIS